jgi:hypothetical protein
MLLPLVFTLLASVSETGFVDSPFLPPPPRAVLPEPESVGGTKAVSIDPLSRAAVATAYQLAYLPQGQVAADWTGNVSSCDAGSSSASYRAAVIDRVNFFRALAGLPGTVQHSSDAAISSNAQAAALMMSAEGRLSHFPASGWACYSAAGAGSNGGAASDLLALGRAGPAAVDLYIDDPGSGNHFVGHRRWLLFPPQQVMASGDIPSGTRSNALWVFGPQGSRPPTPQGVAWPPRGFVPFQVLPTLSNRWSLSLPNAGFDAASVSMSVDGLPIAVTVDSRTSYGYGDNTLVWRPATGTGAVVYGSAGVDRTYLVSVTGIGGSGVPSSVSYSVTVIDGTEAVAGSYFRNGFE